MNKKKILLIISTALLVAICFAGFGYYKIISDPNNDLIDNFVGKTRNEVTSFISSNNINEENIIFDEEYDEVIEKDKVIFQSVKPGEGKYKDGLILTFSKGYDPELEIELPDITDMMEEDIMIFFEKNRFSNVEYQFIEPDKTEEKILYGKVLGMSKTGLVKRNEKILVLLADVVESKEEELEEIIDEYVEIPDFKGYTIERFANWTHEKGLKYYVYEKNSDDFEKGEVIAQTPSIGGRAKKGSTVTITISLGKALILENLNGKTQVEATKYAETNNLKIKVTEEYSRTVEKGKIIKTNPKGGEKYNKGDTLTITISKGTDVMYLGTDYTGKSEAALKSAVEEKHKNTEYERTEKYSNYDKGLVISHDTAVSLTEKFKYSVSLGSYIANDNFKGQYVADVQAILKPENEKGADVGIKVITTEITRDNTLDNKIKSCSFENKTYNCVIYKYEEAKSTFVVSDFKNFKEGNTQYVKDGNTYNISIIQKYTDYNDETPETFNTATSSDGEYVKNGTIITIYINKGPKPVVYGGNITWNLYSACEIPDDNDNPSFDKVKNCVIEKLTSSNYDYSPEQIQCNQNDTILAGYIDIDSSTQGKFIVNEEMIIVSIGSAPREN